MVIYFHRTTITTRIPLGRLLQTAQADLSEGGHDFPNGLWRCIRAWQCPPTSPRTDTTPGITSTRRPALRSTSPPPESPPCCPTCRPVTRPTSPTASVGTTAGPKPAQTAPLLRPAALTPRTAFRTRTAPQSAATPAATRPTRARWSSPTALGQTSTGAPWCARSRDRTLALTRTWARRWQRPPGRRGRSRAEWSACRDGTEDCLGEGPVWVSTEPETFRHRDHKVSFIPKVIRVIIIAIEK